MQRIWKSINFHRGSMETPARIPAGRKTTFSMHLNSQRSIYHRLGIVESLRLGPFHLVRLPGLRAGVLSFWRSDPAMRYASV